MLISPARRILAGHQRVLCNVDQRCSRAVCERDENAPVQRVSLAARQSCENRDRRILPGDNVGERNAHPRRLSVGVACDGHPATFSLNDEIVSGPVAPGPESGDRAPDELLMGSEQLVGKNAPSLERARRKLSTTTSAAARRPRTNSRSAGRSRSAVALILFRLTER